MLQIVEICVVRKDKMEREEKVWRPNPDPTLVGANLGK